MTAVAATPALAQDASRFTQDAPKKKDAPEFQGQPSQLPTAPCRDGYNEQGAWLCMTDLNRGPNTFANAMLDCRNFNGGRVADYHDWRYRFVFGDGFKIDPDEAAWLGPITADDRALYANRGNPLNFDGEANRFQARIYACAHDRF